MMAVTHEIYRHASLFTTMDYAIANQNGDHAAGQYLLQLLSNHDVILNESSFMHVWYLITKIHKINNSIEYLSEL